MGPATSGRGLCDIDIVLFRVAKSRVKKWGVLAGAIRNTENMESLLFISHLVTITIFY